MSERNLLISGGPIYTCDSENPLAEALLVSGNRIICLGEREKVEAHPASMDPVRLDLEGNPLLPGFSDSHLHLRSVAKQALALDLNAPKSLMEILSMIKGHASKLQPENWIYGVRFDDTRWPEKKLPSLSDLDDLHIPNPVILVRVCSHIHVANTRALEKAGLSTEKGLLFEDQAAPLISLMEREMSSPSIEKEMLYRTCRKLAGEGITSAHTCGTASYGLEENIPAYVKMHELGSLALRIVHYSDEMPEKGIRSGHGDEWISYGGYKMFLDGSLGGRTAALTSPYEDQWENMGMLNMSQEEVTARMREAHERGIQAQVHAIGDAAIDQFIRALRSLKAVASPKSDLRHRIVHLQVCRPDQIVELRKLKAICDIQPVFVPSDIGIASSRLGKWRSGWAYPWKDMLSAGLHLNGSSDAPVEPTSPLRGIWAAINRTSEEGEPLHGWRPDQCLSLEETLPLFTSNPPLAVGRGNQLGRIREGFLADMVILDRDIWKCPPQEIRKIKPLFTFVDGKLSHGRIEDWPSIL